MKIVTWNINGIRASYTKGAKEFLHFDNADVFCLQEIKANADQFPEGLLQDFPYHYIHSAQKKGYSGVAILSKIKPLSITYGLDEKKFDDEGRVLIAEYKNYFLMNCYFPNGQRDHGRVPYKLAFSNKVLTTAQKLIKKYHKPIVICGDYNTAHQEIDLANPKSNSKTTGFLPIERQWMDKFVKLGFVDCFRHLHPEEIGAYSWWTYRGDCRARNIGWRIDYFFVSKLLEKNIQKCVHLDNVFGSDHCPVQLELK